MASVFLSHSSKDKEFVEWLANQLKELGHSVWFDKWEIGVGDCIVTEIEKGIGDCDFVVIVLSPNAVSSTWVDREWKAKYWDEIQKNKTLVLPILMEKCDIPILLKTRHYADFSGSERTVAFAKLVLAISPTNSDSGAIQSIALPDNKPDVHSLLSRLSSRQDTLAHVIADALALAHKLKNKDLEHFCVGELTGWNGKDSEEEDKALNYRCIEAFASTSQINMNFMGWSGNVQNIFKAFQNNPKQFTPVKFFMKYSVAQLESFNESGAPQNSVLHVTMPLKEVNKDHKGDAVLFVYMRDDTYRTLLDSIRQQLTQHLIELLPRA